MSAQPPPPADTGDKTKQAEESAARIKEIADLKDQMAKINEQMTKLIPAESDDPAADSDETVETDPKPPKKESKAKEKPDPIKVDYAETLKGLLGKSYDKDLDKLPLDVRIPTMKALLKTVGAPAQKEGVIPKPQMGENKLIVVPNRVNYMEMAKKIRGEK
jgi:hypothetical protein